MFETVVPAQAALQASVLQAEAEGYTHWGHETVALRPATMEQVTGQLLGPTSSREAPVLPVTQSSRDRKAGPLPGALDIPDV